MTWTGGCLCGAVRFESDAEILWLCHCHCGMCRKHSGAPLATFVIFPAGAVSWTGRQPSRYRSSQDVERSFCPTCGSSIGFHRAHETSLGLGSFDRPDDIAVERSRSLHVMYGDHIAWFDTADDWPRHETRPSGVAEEHAKHSGQAIV